MKPIFTRTLFAGIFTLAFPTLQAAPAVLSGDEWSLPLEDGSTLVIVDAPTGQLRWIDFSNPDSPSTTGPIFTGIPDITHVSGGYFDDKSEWLSLSSVDSNTSRLVQLESEELKTIIFPQLQPGPDGQVPLQLKDEKVRTFGTARYANGGHGSTVLEDLFGDPTLGNLINDNPPLTSLQSHRSFTGERHALLIVDNPKKEPVASLVTPLAEDPFFSLKPLDLSLKRGVITTEIIGDDDRRCALVYLPAKRDLQILTLPENGFEAALKAPGFELFDIGSITAVAPEAPGEAQGAWITSDDGTQAAHVIIREGAELEIVTQIEAPKENPFRVLHSLGVHGLVTLHRNGSGGSSQFQRWQWDTGNNRWNGNGLQNLPTLTSGGMGFPTLFWFNARPLVDPTAEVVSLQVEPDWTIPTSNAPVPASVQLAMLGGSMNGLTPAGNLPLTTPTGATHVLANQYAADVSLSALDDALALSRPSLGIDPPSGNYSAAFQIVPKYDETANALFVRQDIPAASWQLYNSITVSYPSTWLFYLRNKSTGVSSQIVTRSYLFPGADLNKIDSDADGVPDYVELANGLDPNGGADSDGDFQSDLEELLSNTNPNNKDSRTLSDREPPFIGEGFTLVAQASGPNTDPGNAKRATGDPLKGGTSVTTHNLEGNLLSEGLVERFTAARIGELGMPDTYTNATGALISVNNSIPEFEWVTLATPSYWAYQGATENEQKGRETLRVMSRPINELPTISNIPTGNDLTADANAWINAARTAYSGHAAYSGITQLNPKDNVTSVLAEAAIYAGLGELTDPTTLGVPATADSFTLFPFRETGGARAPLNSAMKAALIQNGFDFNAVIDGLVQGVDASAPLINLATAIHQQHIDVAAANPLMLFPLDALRSLLVDGSIQDPDGGGRTNPYTTLDASVVSSGRAAMLALLNDAATKRRPVATWTVTVQNSGDALAPYQFSITSSLPVDASVVGELAWPVDRFGDRVALDQGIGLAPGTTLQIRGFTDAEAPAGFEGMEVLLLLGSSIITPTDTDTDADLLDDGWEEMFFGSLTAVTGNDTHPTTGHTYLQYQIAGEDPRAGTLTTPPASTMPENIELVWVPAANTYDVIFDFPAGLVANFNFSLDVSGDLQNFTSSSEVGDLETVSPGRYRLRSSALDASNPTQFWRVRIELKE